jgi:hypothetical protein
MRQRCTLRRALASRTSRTSRADHSLSAVAELLGQALRGLHACCHDFWHHQGHG